MRRVSTFFVAFLLGAPAAGAQEVVCGLAQSDVVVIDGLLDDWEGVKGLDLGSGSGDADTFLRCNYDQTHLFISVFVSDDRLVRTKQGGRGEDHVVFVFGKARAEVYPGHSDYNAKRRFTSSGLGKVESADSLQPKGWSVELAVPLRNIPGWARGTPSVPFRYEHHDGDMLSERRIQEVVGTSERGRLSFAEGADVLAGFLADQKLKASDLQLDVLAEMDGEAGLERVVWAGRLIGILSEQYTVLQLPVPKKDVLSVKVVDLAGTKKSLLARWVERGNGGSREILAVFNIKPGGTMMRTFAHEISKQLGPNRVSNVWAIEPIAELNKSKGKKNKKAPRLPGRNAIVIRPGEAVGFSQDNWREWPAEDMRPILLPWGQVQEEVWAFSGDEVFGGEAAARAGTARNR